MEDIKKKSVCIIGGGPAGLVSLKRVLDSPFLTGTIFEQKDEIGGVWRYERGEKIFQVSKKNLRVDGGVDDPECVTTMYDDLTCNLPYPFMQFLDFPYEAPPRTFLTQQEVQEYLVKYANHFNLGPHIQLNTSVISVRPENPITSENLGKPGRWIVETHNHKDDVYATTVFDAVMVCVGKNSYPYQPPVFPGLEQFKGQVLHSKYFKNAEEFRGKSVVLIGLGPSSADLTLHLSKTVKNVTVCHKFGGGFGLGLLPENARETKNVKRVMENGVVTEEDEEVVCDAIIFCTGYGLKFPFFGEEIEVLEEKYVPNLYKMTIFTKIPTLAILNLCYRSPEYMIIEAQAKYVVNWLEMDEDKRPSYQEMETIVKAEENEKIEKGWPRSLWFQTGEYGAGNWKYFSEMLGEIGRKEEICGDWPLLECLIMLIFLKRIFAKLALYKKDRFRIVGKDEWEYICGADKTKFPDVEAERVRFSLERETGIVTTRTEVINVDEDGNI